jgi:TPR repeat protein
MKHFLLLLTLTNSLQAVDLEQTIEAFNQQKYDQVFQELSRSENRQSPLIWYYLAQLYGEGLGTTQDIPKAFNYLQKSAIAGIVKAQVDLAQHYYHGDWIKANSKQAVNWWSKAEQQGNMNASYALGRAYFLGQGVTEDHKLAKKMVSKSRTRRVKKGPRCIATD